jgi:hypothetical protein
MGSDQTYRLRGQICPFGIKLYVPEPIENVRLESDEYLELGMRSNPVLELSSTAPVALLYLLNASVAR